MGDTLAYGAAPSISLQLTSAGAPLLLYVDPTNTEVAFLRYVGTGGGWDRTSVARQAGEELYGDPELVLGSGDVPFAAFLRYGWDEGASESQAKVMVRTADVNGATWTAVGQVCVCVCGGGGWCGGGSASVLASPPRPPHHYTRLPACPPATLLTT